MHLVPQIAYCVRAAKKGYLDGAYAHGEPRSELGERIQLQDGQWIRDADVTLSKAGSISGKVVDERGEPLVGAYVRVLLSTELSGQRVWLSGPGAQTDDRGIYYVGNLQAGVYGVVVPNVQNTVPIQDLPRNESGPAPSITLPEHDSAVILGMYPTPSDSKLAYAPTFFPGTTSAREAGTVPVGRGEAVQGADIRLSANPTFAVSGKVEFDGAGAAVILRLIRIENQGLGFTGDTATSRPNSRGEFVFGRVSPGQYILQGSTRLSELTVKTALGSSHNTSFAVPPPTRWASSTWIDIRTSPASTVSYFVGNNTRAAEVYWGETRVSVSDQDVRDARLALSRAGDATGSIEVEDPTGNLTQANWQLRLEPDGGALSQGLPVSERRLDSKSFVIPAVIPGKYVVKLTGVADAFIKSVTWRGEDYTYRPLDVGSAGISDLSIVVTTRTAHLSGRVRTRDGGVPSVVVYFPQSLEERTHYGLTTRRIGLVYSEKGTFDIKTLPAGEYFVAALPFDETPKLESADVLEVLARSAVRVSLVWDSDVRVEVPLTEARRIP